MAIATAYTAVNMNNISVWYGTPTIYNSTHIQIKAGLNQADYYGTGFTFSQTGMTGGTVTRYEAWYNNVKQYSVSGLSLSAVTVNNYLNAGNANGLLSYALAGNDTFNGSAGNDVLNGYNGNDTIFGNAGNDVLNGGAGNDNLVGGAGNDYLNGSTGVDRAYYNSATAGVNVNLGLSTAQATGGAGIDTLVGIESLVGSNYNDTLSGNAAANVLSGGAGNDNLNGGAGNDILYGGAGNDIFDWGASVRGGYDTMWGGAGNDTYVLDSATSDLVGELANEGADLVWASFNATLANLANVENLGLIEGGNYSASGNALNNVLYANSGNNILYGGAGIDTVAYTGSGMASGVTVNLATTTAQATGGSGSDTLTLIENLTGTRYNDVLTGDSLANILNGGAGNDVLSGGNGNDILIGGAGQDTMTSGTSIIGGYNYFDFNAITESVCGTNRDVISDFASGKDKIDLYHIDANTLLAGNQAFTLISGASAFTGAGQIKLAGGILYGNTDADATAEFEITLSGITTLAATDFVL